MAPIANLPIADGASKPASNQAAVSRWSILLAGGQGVRLSKLIPWFHADGRPKQFATLIGTRSMLQHTYDRALAVSPPDKILIVLTAGQERWARQQLPNAHPESFIVQPLDIGTGPALSMAIVRVMAREPDASVAVYPSDHLIHPENKFSESMARVLGAVETSEDSRIVLVGVEPSSARAGMGWILPGRVISQKDGITLHAVTGFMEKPSEGMTQQLWRLGAVWNTFVMMGKARMFQQLLRKERPDVAGRMEQYDRQGPEGRVPAGSEAVFHDLAAFDFSDGVLQPNEGRLALFQLKGVHWRDWGSPESFFQSIEEMGWSDRLDEKIFASEFAELQPS